MGRPVFSDRPICFFQIANVLETFAMRLLRPDKRPKGSSVARMTLSEVFGIQRGPEQMAAI